MNYEPRAEDGRHRRQIGLMRARLADAIEYWVGEGEERDTAIPGLSLMKRTNPIPPTSYLYEPSLAVIAQGRKHVILGTSSYWYDESQFLLTAANLPTITEVVDASAERPYLSIVLTLDLAMAREIIATVDQHDPPSTVGTAMAVGPATAELFDALVRLIDLLNTPADVRVLADLIKREILYRVITSTAGGRLRQIVKLGTQSNRVTEAIAWLRANYAASLSIEELAKRSSMGVSTLHHHFRLLTAMSPIQFQKHLRLHEARRLLLSEEGDAGSIALRVGYESATQFSREYRRLFGSPPITDIKAIRSGVKVLPSALLE